MVTLRGEGLALDVRRGWEARMWTPDLPPPAINRPVVRLANFPLPLTKDTYAEDVADSLQRGQVVASLVEFDPSLADRGLYAPQGAPDLQVGDLDPRAVQRPHPGRAGLQRFFSVNGRAFSLYVIAREGAGMPGALAELAASLRTLTVEAP
ncbi:MAG: hypothetical protein ACM3OO_05210 [Planctomycetaceae bacterium]